MSSISQNSTHHAEGHGRTLMLAVWLVSIIGTVDLVVTIVRELLS